MKSPGPAIIAVSVVLYVILCLGTIWLLASPRDWGAIGQGIAIAALVVLVWTTRGIKNLRRPG